jgi:hypothetical protein
MEERILKMASMFNVKILQQEKLLKTYIDRGFEYHDDTATIKTKLYCYRFEAEQLKKLLKETKQLA